MSSGMNFWHQWSKIREKEITKLNCFFYFWFIFTIVKLLSGIVDFMILYCLFLLKKSKCLNNVIFMYQNTVNRYMSIAIEWKILDRNPFTQLFLEKTLRWHFTSMCSSTHIKLWLNYHMQFLGRKVEKEQLGDTFVLTLSNLKKFFDLTKHLILS